MDNTASGREWLLWRLGWKTTFYLQNMGKLTLASLLLYLCKGSSSNNNLSEAIPRKHSMSFFSELIVCVVLGEGVMGDLTRRWMLSRKPSQCQGFAIPTLQYFTPGRESTGFSHSVKFQPSPVKRGTVLSSACKQQTTDFVVYATVRRKAFASSTA